MKKGNIPQPWKNKKIPRGRKKKLQGSPKAKGKEIYNFNIKR